MSDENEQAAIEHVQPGRNELNSKYEPRDLSELMSFADRIVQSNLIPDGINRAEDVVMIVQQGRELGISAMASLQQIYVVKGQATISAKLCVALVQQSPDCEYFYCAETTPKKATWKTKRKNNPEPQTLTWTIQQANAAGLTTGKGSNVWQAYPDVMLRHRAAKYLGDMVYPEVTAGLYLAEELGAVVNEDGEPIDIGQVQTIDADPSTSRPKQKWFKIQCDGTSHAGRLDWQDAHDYFLGALQHTGVEDIEADVKAWISAQHGVDQIHQVPADILNKWAHKIGSSDADKLRANVAAHDSEPAADDEPTPQPDAEPDVIDADFEESSGDSESQREQSQSDSPESEGEGKGGTDQAQDEQPRTPAEEARRQSKVKLWNFLISFTGIGDKTAFKFLDAKAEKYGFDDRGDLPKRRLDFILGDLQSIQETFGDDEVIGEIKSIAGKAGQ